MRKFALILVVSAASAISFADQVPAEIKAVYAKLDKAMKNRDAKAFEGALKGFVTKDFKHIQGTQEMDFKTMIEMVKQGVMSLKSIDTSSSHFKSFKVTGNKAVAMTIHKMGGIMDLGDGKKHTFTYGGDSKDEFVKVSGKWRMSRMTWGKDQMTMDGKPFDPSKMQGAAAEKH